ncbi:MAG: PDZ domain-containing protein [Elusimicrobia bacterium]|nr:PDZ domain-containing protein [Elusimicrobiota bacterium]
MTSILSALTSGLLLLAFRAPLAAAPSDAAPAAAEPVVAAPAEPQPSAARKAPARTRSATRRAAPRTQAKPAGKAKAVRPAAPRRPSLAVPERTERSEAPAGAPAKTGNTCALAALGAIAAETPAGPEVLAVVPGSEAASMELAPGDRLTHLFSSPTRTSQELRDRMKTLPAEGRLSAVVARGLGTRSLSGQAQAFAPAALRGPDELSSHEILLKEKRLAAVQSEAEAEVLRAAPQEFRIAAGQSLWLHFPKGIPSGAGPGDIVQAEATTAVCTDQSLDYLSLPPKTLFWAKVLDSHGPAQTNNLRLFFFKMRLPGGSYYPVSGRVADIAGADGRLVKLTAGGTIVMPNETNIDSDVKVRLELAEPVTLIEPPAFYAAGAGLWIKTREDGPGFKISHIIPGRSAAAAGLQPGDVIMSINGSKASAFDFPSAVAAIYGEKESTLKLGVIRLAELESSRPKTETIVLKRGVSLASAEGETVPLPPPYADPPKR